MPKLTGYNAIIAEAIGDQPIEVLESVQDIMRHDIFHSTLDWQTREQLKDAAREGFQVHLALAGTTLDRTWIDTAPYPKAGKRDYEVRDPTGSVLVTAEQIRDCADMEKSSRRKIATREDVDLDDRFVALDVENNERIVVNGWLCTFEDATS